MKSHTSTKIIVVLFGCLVLIGLAGCNNPSPSSSSSAPLTFKQIEAKILRGESVGEAEIKNLSSEELRRLRNTAFAKYGKVFQKPGLGDYFATCDWYKPNPSYKDADADKLLTANDKQNVQTIQRQEESAKLNQSNSTNSAPQIISNAGNTSITNTQVQPIEQANGNTSIYTAPVHSSKTISYEDLISMVNDAPNQIAVEEKIKDYFGEQDVLVKDVPVFQVSRNDAGRLFVKGGSVETMGIATVFFVEEKDKQRVTSLKAPGNFFEESEKVNIRCTYDQVSQAKDSNIVILKFNFVAIE